MVFDESHKLIDAARQMYSTVWDEQDAEFIVGLSEVNRRTTGMDELTVLRSQLAEYNRQIFGRLAGDLAGNHTREGGRIEIVIGSMENLYEAHGKGFRAASLILSGKQRTENAVARSEKRYQELTDKLTVFLNSGNSICWMEKGRTAGLPCVRFQWNWNRFYSVTSGADRYRLLLRPAQCQSGVILGTLRE